MTHADDLRVARDQLRTALSIYADSATADSIARTVEALIDAKLRTLTLTYVNPMTGVAQQTKARGG